MKKNQSCGIYKIENMNNGKFYIGSSKRVEARWSNHKKDLKQQRHHSVYLQASYNKHGVDNFTFEIIELCEEDKLLEREQFYLDTLKPAYNTEKIAGKPPIDPVRSSRVAKANWASGKWDYTLRAIERIDPNSGEIKEYKSMSEAERDGFEQGSVWACVAGKKASFSNYYWQYADGSTPATSVQYEKVFRKVIGESVSGENKVWLSSYDECHSLGFNYGKIRACCAGLRGRRTHKEYRWYFSDEHNQRAAETAKYRTHQETFSKSVIRTNPVTREEKIYVSQAEAGKDGFRPGDISSCCLGKRKTHNGYEWKFYRAEK